jgi:predicted permease
MKKIITSIVLLFVFITFINAKNYYVAALIFSEDQSTATVVPVSSFNSNSVKEAHTKANNAIKSINNNNSKTTFLFINENESIVQSLINKKIAETKTRIGEDNIFNTNTFVIQQFRLFF